MRKFTERLESWYNERMAMFDEDASFRAVQETKYGGRDGYSASVFGVVEGKISGARAKAEQAVAKAKAEGDRLAAEAERLAAEEAEAAEAQLASIPTDPALPAWLQYHGFAACMEQLDDVSAQSVSWRRSAYADMNRRQRVAWLSRLLDDCVALRSPGGNDTSQMPSELRDGISELRHVAEDGIASVVECEDWQTTHTRCCDAQAQLVTSTLRVLLQFGQNLLAAGAQASHHPVSAADSVKACVDEAGALLMDLYDAVEFCGTEEENMRHGNVLLGDHSHALTALDEGARCVYAVADAVRQQIFASSEGG
jgi:hypothetical protein